MEEILETKIVLDFTKSYLPAAEGRGKRLQLTLPPCPKLSDPYSREWNLVIEFSLPGIVQQVGGYTTWADAIQYVLLDKIG